MMHMDGSLKHVYYIIQLSKIAWQMPFFGLYDSHF